MKRTSFWNRPIKSRTGRWAAFAGIFVVFLLIPILCGLALLGGLALLEAGQGFPPLELPPSGTSLVGLIVGLVSLWFLGFGLIFGLSLALMFCLIILIEIVKLLARIRILPARYLHLWGGVGTRTNVELMIDFARGMRTLALLIVYMLMHIPIFLLLVWPLIVGPLFGLRFASFVLLVLWAIPFYFIMVRLDQWGWGNLCDRIWPWPR
jgi:hypothetical protein